MRTQSGVYGCCFLHFLEVLATDYYVRIISSSLDDLWMQYPVWTFALHAFKKNFIFCSNPGHPFSSGFTLAKLAAVTMDEQGNETFDTSGALDKLRKVFSCVDTT